MINFNQSQNIAIYLIEIENTWKKEDFIRNLGKNVYTHMENYRNQLKSFNGTVKTVCLDIIFTRIFVFLFIKDICLFEVSACVMQRGMYLFSFCLLLFSIFY